MARIPKEEKELLRRHLSGAHLQPQEEETLRARFSPRVLHQYWLVTKRMAESALRDDPSKAPPGMEKRWAEDHAKATADRARTVAALAALKPKIGTATNAAAPTAKDSSKGGAVQTGERGGKYLLLKSGKRFYVTASGGRPVVKPA